MIIIIKKNGQCNDILTIGVINESMLYTYP